MQARSNFIPVRWPLRPWLPDWLARPLSWTGCAGLPSLQAGWLADGAAVLAAWLARHRQSRVRPYRSPDVILAGLPGLGTETADLRWDAQRMLIIGVGPPPGPPVDLRPWRVDLQQGAQAWIGRPGSTDPGPLHLQTLGSHVQSVYAHLGVALGAECHCICGIGTCCCGSALADFSICIR